jgi:acyl-CoA thioester hydrolase
MRPKPFVPVAFDEDERFVRNRTDDLVWHRSYYRTLYADTDRSQIVYHAHYLRYFEVGRASLMRDFAFPYREIEQNGYVYPIIQLAVDFYSPLYYDDLMCIYTRPGQLERVKLNFDYILTRSGTEEIVCTGYTRHCATNSSSGKPVEIDEMTLRLWQEFPK